MAAARGKTAQSGKRRRTQDQRREESTGRMLAAAAQLFAQQGYDRTTLEQIGKQAGYSGPLVISRFGSKSGLVKALLQDIQARSRERIEKLNVDQGSAIDGVDKLIGLYMDAGLSDKPLRAFFVLMAESAGPLQDMRSLFAEHNRILVLLFESVIARGQRSGEIDKSVDAHSIALEIAALLRGVTLLWLVDSDLVDPREFFRKARLELRGKLSVASQKSSPPK